MTCSRCGEAKPDVEERWDPYRFEVYEETVLDDWCYDCWLERKAEV